MSCQFKLSNNHLLVVDSLRCTNPLSHQCTFERALSNHFETLLVQNGNRGKLLFKNQIRCKEVLVEQIDLWSDVVLLVGFPTSYTKSSWERIIQTMNKKTFIKYLLQLAASRTLQDLQDFKVDFKVDSEQ